MLAVSNPADAKVEAARRAFDMAFVDLRLGSERGLDLIPVLIAGSPWMKVVVITAEATIDSAVASMKSGSVDYLPKPCTPLQVKHVARRIGELRRLEQNVESLRDAVGRTNPELDLRATHSPAMQRALHLAQQVAATDATVLVRGASGTGKGVMVRAIHGWSARREKPFGTVSCPSLSAELLESELFGHVKGAFTTAVRDNPGRIAMCEGGTLFLDEIGDLPLSMQPKLLRFIQDHEYERIGDQTTRRADIRVVTATNIDLDKAVADGRFREDLLYRLNVIQIEIPALRDRARRYRSAGGADGGFLLAKSAEENSRLHARSRRGPHTPHLARQCARTAQRDRALRHSGDHRLDRPGPPARIRLNRRRRSRSRRPHFAGQTRGTPHPPRDGRHQEPRRSRRNSRHRCRHALAPTEEVRDLKVFKLG